MAEHLFKLKKDGKTVGYLKIIGAQVFYGLSLTNFQSCPIDIFKRVIKTPNLRSLSSHPFVTKDKNGKDVFARDSVRSGKRILTIVWDKDYLQWKAKEEGNDFLTPLCQWAISEQFELIVEDKDNEEHST